MSQSPHRPVILTGFMGTGKSTVGRLLANHLHARFVDLDRLIEHQHGAIPEYFNRHGEAAFRDIEAAVLRDTLQQDGRPGPLVLALGGGTLQREENRSLCCKLGILICLRATPEMILKRVGDVSSRPMLNVANPLGRISELLAQRAAAYAVAHYQVESGELPPTDVMLRIVRMLEQERARIHVSVPAVHGRSEVKHDYDIVLGEGVLDQLGMMLNGRTFTSPLAVITDSNVSQRYARRTYESLTRAGLRAFVVEMPAGELHKNLKTVEQLYGELAKRGLERGGAVVALGGGVLGDTAGFVAATWLRGVPLIQVPTNLLSMTDSSIGGKTGVDAPFGKNMIGAFKQPELVCMDLGLLRSLPAVELACGWAEIIKAGLISGRMDGLDRDIRAAWTDPINAFPSLLSAIELKREVVEGDPFEQGKRAWLNLGHTFGHGLEAWSQFRLRHGEAVGLGLMCALRLSHAMGLCSVDLLMQTERLLRLARLPVKLSEHPDARKLSLDLDAVWAFMQADKKKKAGRLNFILARAAGDVFVSPDVDESMARHALSSIA